MSELHYDAFISYRHGGVDQYVAEQLHKKLETFKLPASIVREKKKKGEKYKIERVFRDQEELPLSDNLEGTIVKALENSDNLIVVCTPRFSESIWCLKEVETFIKLHGRHNVYAVLVEGEPGDSFPKHLLVNEKGESVEPLAADFRGKNKAVINKKMKTEILRLVAPIFDLNFDDLRQRHKERQAKAIFRVSMTVSVLAIAFAAFLGFVAIRIANQNELIMDQNIEINSKKAEIEAQALSLEEMNDTLLYKQALSLAKESRDLIDKGDRRGAVEAAYNALTTYDDIEMPYTTEAQRALAEACYAYDSRNYAKSIISFKGYGIIEEYHATVDGDFILMVDSSNTLQVIDLTNYKTIHKVNDVADRVGYGSVSGFIGSQYFYYITEKDHDYKFVVEKINSNKVVCTLDNFYMSIFDDPESDYLLIEGSSEMTVFDKNKLEVIYNYKGTDSVSYAINDGDTLYTYESDYNFSGNGKLVKTDITTGESIESDSFGTDICKGTLIDDENIYLMASSLYAALSYDHIFCFDKETLALKWSNDVPSSKFISLNSYDDNVVLDTSSNIEVFDKESGTSKYQFVFTTDNLCDDFYVNTNGILVLNTYLSNGNMYYINLTDLTPPIEMNYTLDYNLDSAVDFVNGTLGVGYKSQDLLYIAYKYCTYVQPLKEEVDDTRSYFNVMNYAKWDDGYDGCFYYGDSARDEAEKLGLENAAIVKSLNYSPNNNYIVVSYDDYTSEVINKKTLEVIDSIENVLALSDYFGEDHNGNEYYGHQYGYAICVNKDGKIEFVVETMMGLVNQGGETKIVQKSKNYYADYEYVLYPIFDKDSLLMIAEELMTMYED